MTGFIDRHSDNILGQLSCFDRIIIQGTLPDICYPGAITNFFFRSRIKIFDFKQWASPMRDEINENAKSIARENGLEIEFIRKKNFRKDDRVAKIIAKRGNRPGLVHIFSAMETCTAFKPWHDKKSHKTFFKYDSGRCLHYYFYFIDEDYGLCYLRVPTWAPFRLQFYCNAHNWLANQLGREGIGYKQRENAFYEIDSFEKAQEISDTFSGKDLHQILKKYTPVFCPPTNQFKAGIHWSVMQSEYATDIVFENRETLSTVYEELVRTLSHSVKPDNVSMFLGKRLDLRYEGELGGRFSTRIEGHSIRHFMGKNGIKMYDKFGQILRIECFSNDISFFRHHRRVEHRDGSSSYQVANMRKTIYSLSDLKDVIFACNRRYIDFLSAIDDPTNGIKKVNKLSRSVREKGRSFRGFNLFNKEDEAVLRAIAQGGAQGFGIRNFTLRKALDKTSSQISHILRRLRNHGLIKKVSKSYKYYLTSLGREVTATSLKLKEMVVIPVLRGNLNFS